MPKEFQQFDVIMGTICILSGIALAVDVLVRRKPDAKSAKGRLLALSAGLIAGGLILLFQ